MGELFPSTLEVEFGPCVQGRGQGHRPLKLELGVVTYACSPSTWEAEAGRVQVQDQPGPQNEKGKKKMFT